MSKGQVPEITKVKDNVKIESSEKEKQVNKSVSFNLYGICSRINFWVISIKMRSSTEL